MNTPVGIVVLLCSAVLAAGACTSSKPPAPTYAILLVSSNGSTGISLLVGENGIVRVDELLDGSPATLDTILERDAAEVILAPKIR